MGRSPSGTEQSPLVMVADDDPAALRLLLMAFEEVDPAIETITAFDGTEALELLHEREADTEARLPDLVVLDIDMPGRTGLEVLEAIRETDRLHSLPVVMFSQNESQDIVDEAFQLGANAYLTKPADYEGLLEVTRRISQFWTAGGAELPSHEERS